MVVRKACHWAGPKVGEPEVRSFVSRTRMPAEAGTTSTQSPRSALELLVRQLLAVILVLTVHVQLGRQAPPTGSRSTDSSIKQLRHYQQLGRPKCR